MDAFVDNFAWANHVWLWLVVPLVTVVSLALGRIFLLAEPGPPKIEVDTSHVIEKRQAHLRNNYIYIPKKNTSGVSSGDRVQCYDPSTLQYLGFAPVTRKEQVQESVKLARDAQAQWTHSSFPQRRLFLRTLLRHITENQDLICRVSARDSGKTLVDALFGEILVTCEKICWLVKEGERWLRPEYRSPGVMMPYKSARVEFPPLGVIGAIVPWNYPFHNFVNPILSAVFAGNGVVVKVSEHTSWSSQYYLSIVRAALRAAGAPTDLVQVVTGFGETGAALVDSGVDKLIFVGSTAVGKKVMAAAAPSLTPVVLELGGKDAFIVCDDADLSQAVPIALRAAFQCSGQNCIGSERFFVQEGIYNAFVAAVTEGVRKMRVGNPLEMCSSTEGSSSSSASTTACDMGSLCLPGHSDKLRALVDEAVSEGATVAAAGQIGNKTSRLAGGNSAVAGGGEGMRNGAASPGGVREGEGGESAGGRDMGDEEQEDELLHSQFFAPTVLLDVKPAMRIMQEEVFGPVMPILRFSTDADAVSLANDCPFGLGCSVFSSSLHRANRIAAQVQCGMVSINDFAATYMAQSLPFGGTKESGFDRFAGVEGLRGCCLVRSVVQDKWPGIVTRIPGPLQYPVAADAFTFQQALVLLFYGFSPYQQLCGLYRIVDYFVMSPFTRKP